MNIENKLIEVNKKLDRQIEEYRILAAKMILKRQGKSIIEIESIKTIDDANKIIMQKV